MTLFSLLFFDIISQPHGEKRESVSCRFPHRKKRSIMNDGSKEMIAQIKYETRQTLIAPHTCALHPTSVAIQMAS